MGSQNLPYGSGYTAVIADNDENIDVYTDEILMALSSLGKIDLMGLITSTSVAPFNKHVPPECFAEMQRDRLNAVIAARRSGFSGIPDPVSGTKGNLNVPESNRIEDTVPLESPGSRLIVDTAMKMDSPSPLVMCMGGPLTVLADAYLQKPDIADRIIPVWLGGNLNDSGDYNGWADPWAAFIVLSRFTVVAFPSYGAQDDPRVTKEWLRKILPESPLKSYMIGKYHKNTGLPDGRDADGPPVIPLIGAGYVQRTVRCMVDGFITKHDHDYIPRYKEDPEGNIRVVTRCDGARGTELWRGIMGDTRLWANLPSGAS